MINPTLFPIFQGHPIVHANSTRTGGISMGAYFSLNLGLKTNDQEGKVKQNQSMFFDHLNIDERTLVFPQQIHSDHIKIVDRPGIIKNCDALITSSPELFLTIQTADCFPLFMYDPVKHVCAIVHSGWRGAAKNISAKTISKMQGSFGSKSRNILVAIGAGIQQKNYQVDSVTASNFSSKYLLPDAVNHYKLSIQDVIIDQLLERGVAKTNIEVDKTCTFEDQENYFSFRRDRANCGRMMGIIGLKDVS